MNNTKKTRIFDNNFLECVITYMAGDVYWLDRNCVYLGCNDNTAKFMGLNSKQDIIGKTHEDIGKIAKWTAGHTASWKQDVLEVISTGEPKLNIENKPVLLPDGREVFYLSNLVPLFDNKKNVIGVIGTSIDISNHKKIEKLQNEKEIAERTSKFMQRLAGSIAHEIRTPLAIIGINVDLLERTQCFIAKHIDEGAKEKYLKAIKHAIKSASIIIDNILTMIRTLSSGEMIKNEFQYLSIAESVKSALEIYPFLHHEKTLVYFEKSKDFVYYGDEILTQHMLFNLIKNALFSIKEAGKGEIKIQLEKDKTNNNLIFTDTALGIAEKELPHIFDRFEAKKAGTGLGLAFCKTVMHSYGGDISCTSKLGKYAKFTLSFPSNIKKPLK
ncbi:Histidine kinase [Gammaproteobacteria bacterium]